MLTRTLAFLATIFTISIASADVVHIKGSQVFKGVELYNEKPTGESCYITIVDVAPLDSKGMHCHEVEYRFHSVREDLPKGNLVVESRVTNRHRKEYPELKTCAMNVNGTTYGDDIYEKDTEILYNQIFGGMHTTDSARYDYFLTLSPETKMLIRARIHVTKGSSEHDVDCVGFELM